MIIHLQFSKNQKLHLVNLEVNQHFDFRENGLIHHFHVTETENEKFIQGSIGIREFHGPPISFQFRQSELKQTNIIPVEIINGEEFIRGSYR